MIVANVAKRKNVGNLMRSCVALGVERMILCGRGKTFAFWGAQGSERFAVTEHFDKVRDAAADLKRRGFTVCGIEITADAVPVHTHPFRGPTAFLAGGEGEGLLDAHKALCDHFVYIPQHGVGGISGMQCLNVATACAIVLHHYAVWAGYPELSRDPSGADKYALSKPPSAGSGPGSAHAQAVHVEREASRAAAAAAAAEVSVASSSVDDDEE